MIGRATSTGAVRAGLFALIAWAAACARDSKASAYLAHADTALAQRKYPEVIQQSQRALEVDHDDPRASALLGRAYFALGRFAQAYDRLLSARAHGPTDSSVRLDLARYYMIEGRLDDAREQARQLAAADSQSFEARLLLGLTARTTRQLSSGVRGLDSARSSGTADVRRQIALGILYVRTRDTTAAAKAFRSAVQSAPQSPEAHAALANYDATVGRRAEEATERSAAERLLGGSVAGRLEIAEFFAVLGQHVEAKRWLAGVSPSDSLAVPSVRLLAELQLADGDADASRTAGQLVSRDSTDAEALLQRGRARLAAHDVNGARADFDRALRLAPSLAPAHFQYARAQLESSDSAPPSAASAKAAVARATAELQTATKLAAQYPDATFALAELRLRTGHARDAITDLDSYIRENPSSIQGHELLAAVLSASGRRDEANETFHRLIDIDPDRAESHYELGVALQSSGKKDEAVKEFETALTLSPAYADPMTQIVLMDLADDRSGAALDRLDRQLEQVPSSAPLYDLVGLVHAARNEQALAESAYRRAIELDPALADARVRLAELYDATGRYDLAAAQSDSARRIEPRNLRALMALGIACQQRGDTARARQAYEAALAIDPKFAGAANNLALLLADEPGGADRAYQLAAIAKQSAPDDPHVSDTFGWMLYRRGDYTRAITILRQAAAKLPDAPAVLYHLGMTAQKLGDMNTARAALSKAVATSGDFEGKDEARRTLAQIK